jgi:hypothetical protein
MIRILRCINEYREKQIWLKNTNFNYTHKKDCILGYHYGEAAAGFDPHR